MGENVGALPENNFKGFPVPLEIRDEDLDPQPWIRGPDRADDPGEVGGPSIPQVVPGHGGEDGVLEAHGRDGFGDMDGLVRVRRPGPALGDGAESAVAGANIAEEEEGRGLPGPALGDVGTAAALADRMEPLGSEDGGNLEEVFVRG